MGQGVGEGGRGDLGLGGMVSTIAGWVRGLGGVRLRKGEGGGLLVGRGGLGGRTLWTDC